ncbi:MAG: DUF6263 family protein [Candidatus Kapabacteria bacterium]|nr:DUF6263 family protein [Candidatus Kapabacteria bacterium]
MIQRITMTLRPLFAFALCAVSMAGMVVAQQSGTAPAGREYRLQALYRSGIAQNYEVVEQTTVERTHSDSSQKTYERKVTYFVTVRCIESLDGIAKLVVNIDSLIYAFKAKGEQITYDSQKDITPKNFADLNNYIGPLNRTFELTVSPYGEVTKISGDQVEYWRDYLQQNSADLDTVVYSIWMQSLDRENLLQYGDLQKRVIPGLRKAVDSTWNHNLTLRIDGVVFDGKVTSRFASYAGGLYSLITKDTIPVRKKQVVHIYGIPYLSTVNDGGAIVDNTLTLSASGTINEVTTVTNAWFRAKILNEAFMHRITTTTQWKLTGQYQW